MAPVEHLRLFSAFHIHTYAECEHTRTHWHLCEEFTHMHEYTRHICMHAHLHGTHTHTHIHTPNWHYVRCKVSQRANADVLFQSDICIQPSPSCIDLFAYVRLTGLEHEH